MYERVISFIPFRIPDLLNLHCHLIQMPDIIHVFLNRTVRGKLTAACCIKKSHFRPSFFILIRLFYFLLCLGISAETFKIKYISAFDPSFGQRREL